MIRGKFINENSLHGLTPSMEAEGWHRVSNSACEKVYQIEGRWYLCSATLNADGDFWTAELYWPDEFGNRPCVPGRSLEEAVRRIERQIELCIPCGHGRVNFEGAAI